jgi:hypothetical protein
VILSIAIRATNQTSRSVGLDINSVVSYVVISN